MIKKSPNALRRLLNFGKRVLRRKEKVPKNPERTIRLIPGKHNEKIFGHQLEKIIELFINERRILTKPIRLYKTSDGRYLLHAIYPMGSQDFFEVKKNNSGIMFESVGKFHADFWYRKIEDESLVGKGLGKKALKVYLAHQRQDKVKKVRINTTAKSTLLLLLKNGFQLEWHPEFPHDKEKLLKNFGTINEKELIEKLKDPKIPEDLFKLGIFGLFVSKSLRK